MLYGWNRNIIARSTSAVTCVAGRRQLIRVSRNLLLMMVSVCMCIAVLIAASQAGPSLLPRVINNQVVLKEVVVDDYSHNRFGGTGTMVITKRNVKLKVVWKDGSQEIFGFNYPSKKGINPANYVEMIQKTLGSDVRLTHAEIKTAQQESNELTKAAITYDAVDQAKESSGGNQYYSATFQVTKTHEINSTASTNANPIYKFAIDFRVEMNGHSLDITYEHHSKKDSYKKLVGKKRYRTPVPIKKITFNPGKHSTSSGQPNTNARKACPECKLHESKLAGLKEKKGKYIQTINIFFDSLAHLEKVVHGKATYLGPDPEEPKRWLDHLHRIEDDIRDAEQKLTSCIETFCREKVKSSSRNKKSKTGTVSIKDSPTDNRVPPFTDKVDKLAKDALPSTGKIKKLADKIQEEVHNLNREIIQAVTHNISVLMIKTMTGISLPVRMLPDQNINTKIRKIAKMYAKAWFSGEELSGKQLARVMEDITPDQRIVLANQFNQTFQQLLFKQLFAVLKGIIPGLDLYLIPDSGKGKEPVGYLVGPPGITDGEQPKGGKEAAGTAQEVKDTVKDLSGLNDKIGGAPNEKPGKGTRKGVKRVTHETQTRHLEINESPNCTFLVPRKYYPGDLAKWNELVKKYITSGKRSSELIKFRIQKAIDPFRIVSQLDPIATRYVTLGNFHKTSVTTKIDKPDDCITVTRQETITTFYSVRLQINKYKLDKTISFTNVGEALINAADIGAAFFSWPLQLAWTGSNAIMNTIDGEYLAAGLEVLDFGFTAKALVGKGAEKVAEEVAEEAAEHIALKVGKMGVKAAVKKAGKAGMKAGVKQEAKRRAASMGGGDELQGRVRQSINKIKLENTIKISEPGGLASQTLRSFKGEHLVHVRGTVEIPYERCVVVTDKVAVEKTTIINNCGKESLPGSGKQLNGGGDKGWQGKGVQPGDTVEDTSGDAYWLGKDQGGDEYHGEKICKACLHLLAELRHRIYDLRTADRFEQDAQKTLSRLKKEDTAGYTLQRKQRLREEIKDVERTLQDAENKSRKAEQALEKAHAELDDCYRKRCGKGGKPKQKVSHIGEIQSKTSGNFQISSEDVIRDRWGDMLIDDCLFTQPKKLAHFLKGITGLPDDIPELPDATFGESFDHSTGKVFQWGSMKPSASLKSSYKKQLQKKGWKILKDDVLDTQLGPFQRLFAKTKNACISVVAVKAPAGMSHKSVLTIYTYPGPGKYKALGGKDIKLSTGYVEDEFDQPKGKQKAAKGAGKSNPVSGLKLSTGYVEQEPGAKAKTPPLSKGRTGAKSGGNTAMGVAQDVGGVISHAFGAIGECKECADLLKQYMAISRKVADLEARGAREMAPDSPLAIMEPPEFKQRRELKKKLEACLKRCEDLKKTDKTSRCPQPPADYPINVGSKMKVGTGIGKLAGGVAKGLVGGFLGGGGRGGGGDDFFDSEEGPSTSRDQIKKKAKKKFTDTDTGTRIRVGAKATKDGILFSTHIDKAPGKGTFQTVFLEDNDGRRMLPVRYYVYKIWAKITLTVSWTKSSYVDGKLVKRETGGWSESWTKDLGTFVHRELGEMPVEGQPIWRRMGYGRATQGVRGLGTEFPITVDQLEKSGPVSLVIHITRPKQSPVTTVPFIIQASVNKDGDIELTQIDQTPATARCQ